MRQAGCESLLPPPGGEGVLGMQQAVTGSGLSPVNEGNEPASVADRTLTSSWLMQALGTQIAQIGCDLDGPAEEGESGYGPLRAWPGGLCVSRAIGDIDVGSCILAHPHIVQLEVPSDGVRLALASDGVSCCACRFY